MLGAVMGRRPDEPTGRRPRRCAGPWTDRHGRNVVIGEGERDEAPMLYIGEQVGQDDDDRQASPEIDIVDPLEGTASSPAG
jgi:hypothetical protein